MNKKLKLIFPLLLAAGFCLPAFAQDEAAAPSEDPAAGAPVKPAAKPAPKKPAPKKKPKKKKKVVPTSEYKFDAVEKTETYKFDKKANPIVKEKKKKKPAKKAPAAKADDLQEKSLPSAKLKPAKALGEAEQKAGDQDATGQVGTE